MRDAIEPCSLLVVGPDDVPRRDLGISGLEHGVASARILVPPGARWQVHVTQLPLPQRIIDADVETPLLFLITDLEPVLDQDQPGFTDLLFEERVYFKEPVIFLLGAESHHTFNAGAVVPAAIEDDDFTRRWKMLNVALHVQLALLTV